MRRITRLGLACALAVAAVAGSAGAAWAAFSNTPDSTWMTNGQVLAMARSGNTIYIGGKFDSLRACPPGTACPGGTFSVLNIAALDATTGAPIKTFRPTVEGEEVLALAVLGNDLWIGGKITAVNGTPRLNLAAVDLTTGALDPNVDHQVGVDTTDRIRGMISSGGKIYAAGYFTSIDGVARKHLAAFDADGTLDTGWRPRTSGLARTLVADCDGSIIVGGAFRSAAGTGGSSANRATLAVFDPTTGALDPWTPDNAAIPGGVNAFDLAVTDNCDRVVVGYGGSNELAAFDLTDDFGNFIFEMKTGGNVQTVAVRGDRILFGGHFTQVSVICPGVKNQNESRIRFAMSDLDGCVRDTNGNDLDGWTPSFDGKFYGPWEIFPAGNQVWVGGQFTLVSGAPQYMLARFTDTP